MSHAESPQGLLPECHANARPSLWKHKAGDRRFPDHQCLPGQGSGEGAAVSLKLRYMVVKAVLQGWALSSAIYLHSYCKEVLH